MSIIARKRGLLAALAGLGIVLGANVGRAENPPPDDPPVVVIPPPPVIDIPPPPVLPPPPIPDPACTGPNCGVTPPQGHHEAPEPATMLSALIGGGLAGLYGLRRRKQNVQAEATE